MKETARATYETGYTFITAVLRTLEKGRITGEVVQRILQADDFTSSIEALRGTLYQDIFSQLGKNDIDALINWRRESFIELIEKHAPNADLLAVLKYPYEIHNYKTLLKSKIFNINSVEYLSPFGITPLKELQEIIEQENYTSLPEENASVLIHTIETYYTTKRAIIIDLILDSFLYERLLSHAARVDGGYIVDAIRSIIDLINIQTLQRANLNLKEKNIRSYVFIKGGTIPPEECIRCYDNPDAVYGVLVTHNYDSLSKAIQDKSDNPFSVERECDEILMSRLHEANYLLGGPNPIFAYAQTMDIELKAVGVLLSGKKNQLSSDIIKQRIPNMH